MVEVLAAAYQDLRNYIEGNWRYIEARDPSNLPIVRLQVGGDARAKWVHAAGNQELKVQLTLSGSDPDIPLGTIVAKTLLYKGATGGSPMCEEPITHFYILDPTDSVVMTHKVQVPKLG